MTAGLEGNCQAASLASSFASSSQRKNAVNLQDSSGGYDGFVDGGESFPVDGDSEEEDLSFRRLVTDEYGNVLMDDGLLLHDEQGTSVNDALNAVDRNASHSMWSLPEIDVCGRHLAMFHALNDMDLIKCAEMLEDDVVVVSFDGEVRGKAAVMQHYSHNMSFKRGSLSVVSSPQESNVRETRGVFEGGAYNINLSFGEQIRWSVRGKALKIARVLSPPESFIRNPSSEQVADPYKGWATMMFRNVIFLYQNTHEFGSPKLKVWLTFFYIRVAIIIVICAIIYNRFM
jgi:hypothetical protein